MEAVDIMEHYNAMRQEAYRVMREHAKEVHAELGPPCWHDIYKIGMHLQELINGTTATVAGMGSVKVLPMADLSSAIKLALEMLLACKEALDLLGKQDHCQETVTVYGVGEEAN